MKCTENCNFETVEFQVAIKTLIVIHRTLREGDPTFREELLNYSHRGHIFQLSNFKDDSSPLGISVLLAATFLYFPFPSVLFTFDDQRESLRNF